MVDPGKRPSKHAKRAKYVKHHIQLEAAMKLSSILLTSGNLRSCPTKNFLLTQSLIG